uniref:Uncharacterized protein n=1 Tax=Fagus sylvatica TaxID=28930 RepID=A0A2N9IGG9_FAGSY
METWSSIVVAPFYSKAEAARARKRATESEWKERDPLSEDENPPELESEELEVELKNRTSDRVMNHWPRQQRFDGWVSSRVIDESERVRLERGCARPCWTGPGPLEARLGFAWRLTPDWRPEKAPPRRIASLLACHSATISPI